MMIHIDSNKNPRIIGLRELAKPRERREQNLFVIEGVQELTLAFEAGYHIQSVYFCAEIIKIHQLKKVFKDGTNPEIISVSRSVFEKMAYRKSTGGVLAVAALRAQTLDVLKISSNPLLIVLENVEKPGNLGAILRTADAAGVDAVLICDPQTDIFNPNVIRSSLGCVFTVPLVVTTSAEAIAWMNKKNITICASALSATKPYWSMDYRQSCAIIMGTESSGLSVIWLKQAQEKIIIPMSGKIDSINVSTATAVILFEAIKQRQFIQK